MSYVDTCKSSHVYHVLRSLCACPLLFSHPVCSQVPKPPSVCLSHHPGLSISLIELLIDHHEASGNLNPTQAPATAKPAVTKAATAKPATAEPAATDTASPRAPDSSPEIVMLVRAGAERFPGASS